MNNTFGQRKSALRAAAGARLIRGSGRPIISCNGIRWRRNRRQLTSSLKLITASGVHLMAADVTSGTINRNGARRTRRHPANGVAKLAPDIDSLYGASSKTLWEETLSRNPRRISQSAKALAKMAAKIQRVPKHHISAKKRHQPSAA